MDPGPRGYGPDVARNPEPYGAVGRSEWMDVDWQEHLRWVRV
jgi:hypothetical protein